MAKNDMVSIDLEPDELIALLECCFTQTGEMPTIKENSVIVDAEELNQLRKVVLTGMHQARDVERRRELFKVLCKIAPDPVSEQVQDLIDRNFENIDDLNRQMLESMKKRNAAPDPALGGLSPELVSRLIHLDWDDNNFPLSFNKNLKREDLDHSPFFVNAVVFLRSLIELEGEKTATATGNLNRKVVKYIFDKMVMPEETRQRTLKYNKVLNEQDVWLLHTIRLVCSLAGLVQKRKDKFTLPRKHRHLLEDNNSGEFYYRLFYYYLRHFNLAYRDRLPELECVQRTICYSISRLSVACNDCVPVRHLYAILLLPSVIAEIESSISDHLDVRFVISSRIIRPLEEFGLLETIDKESAWQGNDKIIKTSLFDKFITPKW